MKKSSKGRYGVDVTYEIGKSNSRSLAMRAIDRYLHNEITKAVPRIRQLPDSGFLMGDPLRRDLQYDWSVSKNCLSRAEAKKIAAVAKRAGAGARVRRCKPIAKRGKEGR